MYKNVSNQHIVGVILLFSSCLLTVTAKAQATNETPTVNYANADIKSAKNSNQPTYPTTSSLKLPETDTSWKPVRRIWGYTFGDFYYDAHADANIVSATGKPSANGRGGETNYSGAPTYRNAFQFRRIYLGYDYDISKKFSVEILLASEPNANTATVAGISTSTTTLTGANGATATTTTTTTTTVPNSDNLVDGKMSFYIKLFNLRVKSVWNGSDLIVGEQLTPAFAMLTEKIWGYRSIERTISDFHRTNAYDVGAGLQGFFDPASKNFGYDILIGNNSTATLGLAANANTGFYKAFYGDVFAKFLDQKLIFDLYADYMKIAPATAVIGGQDRNMLKGFVAYTTPKITFGLEAFTQQVVNGVTNVTNNKAGENATIDAFSIYAHGAIYKDKLGFFARYDGYNPDNDLNSADVYTVSASNNLLAYNPFQKETFYTAGLDFTPAKNIHFMPNLWLIDFKDQRDPSAAGYVANDHTLVYRATFFYIFGK
jgi:hypothetical protein